MIYSKKLLFIIFIAPCKPNPCKRRGKCVDDGKGGFKCKCKKRFCGAICQISKSTVLNEQL